MKMDVFYCLKEYILKLFRYHKIIIERKEKARMINLRKGVNLKKKEKRNPIYTCRIDVKKLIK